MPQNGSSGAAFAIATARGTSSSIAFSARSEDDTIAWRLPTKTRKPEVLALGALQLLELAEPARMADRGALDQQRVGGVGAGALGAADQVGEEIEIVVDERGHAGSG